MFDLWTLSVLGLVQGLTEFLPVSSSGHLILAHALLDFSVDGLAIDAVLQLATVLAVIVYFRHDLWSLRLLEHRSTLYAILIGTIPAVVLGVFLEDTMATLFRSPQLVAYALLAGSLVMLAAEYFARPRATPRSWLVQGLIVGLFQALALVPGMSRSGMTISGGMFVGLTRSEAARFGFLLSIPILAGSGLKKLYDLGADGALASLGLPLVAGSVVAFLSGLVAIYLVLAIVRRTPLTVFVVYRVLLALLILTVL